MTPKLQRLNDRLLDVLGERVAALTERLGELTLEVRAADYLSTAQMLRDHPALRFAQLIDLCGIDYSTYGDRPWPRERYAVALQLLSLEHNWRLRLRAFCPEDALPRLDSVIEVWPSVNWFEREAFDLFGIVFEGHPDLRRILTDYGFVGHPFRKDFPMSGYVEMRYDPEQRRIIYEPVTIEPREVTPRVVRDAAYGERE
ncbi:MAG: NADH-quinone oxidoreductase subunit C [Betaproteobacteria bacterium]|jgi:NADH-quinone oxidoreductase subunit C|nr:NADH-quinone oxidoreductase subunit C [Betaproteobacteria bacterium]